MKLLGWLTGGIGKAAEGIGNAVNKNYRTIKGDVAEKEQHINAEQLATLAQFQSEFVARPTRTKLDSFVDALNRLPRPILTFGIIAAFLWPIYDPSGFIDFMAAIQLIPQELWTLFMMILGFWFGSRIISEDLKKPKLTDEQRRQAIEIVKKRSDDLAKAKTKDETEKAPPVPATLPPEKLPDIPAGKIGSAAVEDMIADLIRREAGYVNDPADSGGPTKYGITQKTLSAWRETDCSIPDVQGLMIKEAADIYRSEYYFLPRIDVLPDAIQAHVFDIGVNAGPRTAIRLLQRTLNRLGCGIDEDGIMGPQTVEAVMSQPISAINTLLVSIRIDHYESIVDEHPEKVRFLKGWRDRANLFLERQAA